MTSVIGKLERGRGSVYTNKLTEIKDHRRQKMQQSELDAGEIKGIKYSGGDSAVFSNDSAHVLVSCFSLRTYVAGLFHQRR